MPGTEIMKPGAALTKGAKIPEAFHAVIAFEAWAQSVVYKTPYKEPNPDFISAYLALLAITGETPEEIFQIQGVEGIQVMLEDVAGAKTPPMEITDLYVATSEFETGAPCYVIVSAVNLEDGSSIKFTTGALSIQATLIGLLKIGTWPIRCIVKRGDALDKGGRHLLFLLPPD